MVGQPLVLLCPFHKVMLGAHHHKMDLSIVKRKPTEREEHECQLAVKLGHAVVTKACLVVVEALGIDSNEATHTRLQNQSC